MDVVGLGMLLFLVVGWAVWAGAVLDVFSRSDEAFAAAGRSRTVWIALVVLLGALSGLVYLVVVRPQLRDHDRERLADRRERVPFRRKDWCDPFVID